MGKVSFGRTQIKNPTPSNIVFWIRVFSAVAGVLMIWMPTASYIPHGLQDVATSILGLGLAVGNAISPLFGVEIKSDTVAKEDVTAVEPGTKIP